MPSRWSSLLLACALLCLAACSSKPPHVAAPSGRLPSIPLYGRASTPSHNMRPGDYPFDANGNYVTSWAAQGGSYATHPMLRSSHHYDEQPRSRSRGTSGVTKVSSSPPKPKAKTSSGTTTKSKSSTTKSSSTAKKKPASRTHTVRSNDTLWGIAKKYGSSVDKIKKANSLTSDVLRDGRKLIIP